MDYIFFLSFHEKHYGVGRKEVYNLYMLLNNWGVVMRKISYKALTSSVTIITPILSLSACLSHSLSLVLHVALMAQN